MKKFFLFAAALVAAMTVNAKYYNFAGITADQITTDGTLGTYVMDSVEIPSVSQPDGVDINVRLAGMDGLVVNYTQSAGKSKNDILKFAADYMQADGKDVILTLSDLAFEDEIQLLVSAKGSTNAVFAALSGADADAENPESVGKAAKTDDYVVVKFWATGSTAQIKETAGGYRIIALAINEDVKNPGQGIEDTKTAVKAEKFFRNGQLVIRKNGVEFNAIGAKL